jgi:hypothetical protein
LKESETSAALQVKAHETLWNRLKDGVGLEAEVDSRQRRAHTLQWLQA